MKADADDAIGSECSEFSEDLDTFSILLMEGIRPTS